MQNYNPGKKSFTLSITVIFILLLAGIPAVSAFTATRVAPADINNVYPGDTVNIRIDGILATDAFTIELISTDMATNAGTVTLSNFNMPFGFSAGTATTTLTTTGIPGTTTLSVTDASDTIYTKTGAGSPNTIATTRDITRQVYKTISISGTPSGSTVGIDYTAGGTSVSAGFDDPAYLTFTLNGVNTGNLRILVEQGATTRLEATLRIVARPVYDGGDGGSNDYPGYSAPIATKASGVPVVPAINPTEITFQQNEEGKVLTTYTLESDPAAGFSSTVTIPTGTRVLSSTGQVVTGISIIPIDAAAVPAAEDGVYSFSGFSLECVPSGTTFSQPVTIVFSLTPAQWAEALSKTGGDPNTMTIRFYDAAAGAWIAVPTTVDPITHHVSASVTHFSIYALFYKTPPMAATSPATPATDVALVPETPVGTPIPQPTKSPMIPGILVIGVIGLAGYFITHKKR